MSSSVKKAPKANDIVPLPEYCGKHEYYSLCAGKFFHKHLTAGGLDQGLWAFQDFASPGGGDNGMLWEAPPHPF